MKGLIVILLSVNVLCLSCRQDSSSSSDSQSNASTSTATAPPARTATDISVQLTAGATADQIATHLLEAEHEVHTTHALVMHYFDMDRETAYEVQLAALESEAGLGEQLIGWKMGGTNTPEPDDNPDPSFAYIMNSDRAQNNQSLSPSPYIGDSVLVEAEIAFIMGQDLPGPEVSKEQLTAAVESVAGSIELISIRLSNAPDGSAPTMNHMIAARLSHAGVILGDERVPLSEFDLANEQVVTTINGEERAAGRSNEIMNTNPLDALLWIANALPKHGRHLRAGDIVITGSLYANPTLKPGEEAVVRFSSLGRMSVSLMDVNQELE